MRPNLSHSTNGNTSGEMEVQGNELALLPEERLVKLSYLHKNDYQHETEDFILARVIWRSERSLYNSKICRFILADDTDHIMAYFFTNNIGGENLYKTMKPQDQILKTKKFTVDENCPEDWQVLKHQSKRLQLRGTTIDVKVITDITTDSINDIIPLRYFPLEFIQFREVDDCSQGTVVDIIGYVKEIFGVLNSAKEQSVKYQRIRFSTCSSAVEFDPDDEFQIDVTLYDDSIGKIERQEAIYALKNVRVDFFDYEKRKTLKSTSLTIAIEVTRENVRCILPPKYHYSAELKALLPSEERSISGPSQPIRKTIPRKSDSSPSLPVPSASKRAFSHHAADNFPTKKSKGSSENPSTLVAEAECKDESSDDESGDEFPNKIYDFLNEFKPFDVRVIPAKKLKGGRKKAYTMRSNLRGIALIINNYYFPERKTDFIREGSNNDVVYLVKFLRACKFQVIVKDNVESKDLSTVLAEFKDKAVKEMDACFVAVLSHGMLECVEMTDGKIVPLHNDIIYQLDDLNFPLFKGKPKMIVVQACQNIGDEVDTDPVMPALDGGRIELDDTIVCYATIPETAAQRDRYLGSHFVYALVDTLMNHAHNRHFVDIFFEVQTRLKKIKKEPSCSAPMCKFSNYGFNKKLYFNPGL